MPTASRPAKSKPTGLPPGPSSSSPPAKRKVRQVRLTATTPSLESIEALLAYFNEAVAYHQPPYTAPAPNPDHLRIGAVQGSVTRAQYLEQTEPPEGPAFSFAIGHGSHRLVTPSGFFLFRVLTLFERDRYEVQPVPGVEVLASGFKLTRLMANADPEEEVRLASHHSDLRPWSMEIVPGHPRSDRQREDAIRVALDSHRDGGGSALLSRDTYAALLKGAFRLFDVEQGAHFLRPLVAG